MIIDTAKYTNSGGHQINEDSILCATDLFVVADGLGGHHGGENASAAAVSYISESYRGDISDNEMEHLLQGANKAVNRLNDDSHTTLAAAFVSGERMRIANVGDSRVYFFRNNKLHTVTRDHSVCQVAVDMGEMSFEDIRFSEDRSRLLKVLGGADTLDLKTRYEPFELYDGDAFLLCSDGFWEYVHEREMEADLLKADSAESWKRLMLKRHLLKAKNEGDNYSLICGIVHSERTLEITAVPETMAIDAAEQRPQKSNKRLMILLVILLLSVLAAVFWFMGGNKLLSGVSGTSSAESAETSLSETVEADTSQRADPVPDETEEQPVTATTESAEQPSPSTDEAVVESSEQPSIPTDEAPVESSVTTEVTTSEPDETSLPATEAEGPLSDVTDEAPSTSGESTVPVEPEPIVPIQPEIPSAPDGQIEPASLNCLTTGGNFLPESEESL